MRMDRTALPVLLLAWALTAAASPVSIPAETSLFIKLSNTVSTETSSANASFRGVLSVGVQVGERQVAPAGSTVTGRIAELQKPSRLRRKSKLAVRLTHLKVCGKTYPISTSITEFKARRDGTVVTNTYMGTVTGGALGGAAGTLVTSDQEKVRKLAAIGAVAGAIVANKRKHIEFRPGQPLAFLLNAPSPPIDECGREGGGGNTFIILDDDDDDDNDDDDDEYQRGYRIGFHEGYKKGFEDGKRDRDIWWPFFWRALAIHLLLSLETISFAWHRSHGDGAWVGAKCRIYQRWFWIAYYAISGSLILGLSWWLNYDLRAPALGWHWFGGVTLPLGWHWLAGGALGLLPAIVAHRFPELFNRIEVPNKFLQWIVTLWTRLPFV